MAGLGAGHIRDLCATRVQEGCGGSAGACARSGGCWGPGQGGLARDPVPTALPEDLGACRPPSHAPGGENLEKWFPCFLCSPNYANKEYTLWTLGDAGECKKSKRSRNLLSFPSGGFLLF